MASLTRFCLDLAESRDMNKLKILARQTDPTAAPAVLAKAGTGAGPTAF